MKKKEEEEMEEKKVKERERKQNESNHLAEDCNWNQIQVRDGGAWVCWQYRVSQKSGICESYSVSIITH